MDNYERPIEPHRSDLAERIIARSYRIAQVQPFTLRGFIREMLGEVLLPRPALALCSLLVIGYIAGVQLYSTAEASTSSMEDVLYNDEDVL